MSRAGFITATLLGAAAAQGAVFVFDFALPENQRSIPDGVSGRSDSRVIDSIPLDRVTDVNVRFNIEGTGFGAFNGDFYATLTYLSGDVEVSSVLLNRPGLSAGFPAGYFDNGLSITLDDQASTDVHFYRDVVQPSPEEQVTGIFQPDGRRVDPNLVAEDTPRTAMLDVFNGLNPNGTWILFVADVSSGGTAQLTDWSLEITAVPEPVHALPVAAVLACGVVAHRMRRRAR